MTTTSKPSPGCCAPTACRPRTPPAAATASPSPALAHEAGPRGPARRPLAVTVDIAASSAKYSCGRSAEFPAAARSEEEDQTEGGSHGQADLLGHHVTRRLRRRW